MFVQVFHLWGMTPRPRNAMKEKARVERSVLASAKARPQKVPMGEDIFSGLCFLFCLGWPVLGGVCCFLVPCVAALLALCFCALLAFCFACQRFLFFVFLRFLLLLPCTYCVLLLCVSCVLLLCASRFVFVLFSCLLPALAFCFWAGLLLMPCP